MRLISCISVARVSFGLALVGCSSASDPDAALTQQVTLALSRATDPALPAAASRDQSLETLTAAVAALKMRADVHAENLLNANTVGYKRRVVVQSDSLTTSVRIDLEQGATQMTDRLLDVSIMGEGFFRVKLTADAKTKTADGTAYTRLGNLFLNSNGDLCLGTRDGPTLLPPITTPLNATQISIAEDGTVSACTADTIQRMVLGRLELTTFDHAELLTATPDGLFAESAASGAPQCGLPKENGHGYVMQGVLENSNVDFTREFLQLSRVAGQSQMLRTIIAKRS